MHLNKLIWYDEYLSEIEIIDTQHQQIFNSFNSFYEALNTGEVDVTNIEEFIEALDSYTTTHFETEEKYMLETNYSGYEEHKSRHEFFKALYDEIKENKVFRYAASHLFALHLATVSGEWWETHIVTHDRELTNFLKKINHECF
jgi:hemerythrin